MFSPECDNPQRIYRDISWLHETGLVDAAGVIIEYEKDLRTSIVREFRKNYLTIADREKLQILEINEVKYLKIPNK